MAKLAERPTRTRVKVSGSGKYESFRFPCVFQRRNSEHLLLEMREEQVVFGPATTNGPSTIANGALWVERGKIAEFQTKWRACRTSCTSRTSLSSSSALEGAGLERLAPVHTCRGLAVSCTCCTDQRSINVKIF